MRKPAAYSACALLAFMLAAVHASPSWAWGNCEYGPAAPLAAANSAGETLVAWQEITNLEHPLREVFCERSRALAAIVSSPTTGFSDLGDVLAPSDISLPTAAFLDSAGNAWVIGTYPRFKQYFARLEPEVG